MSILLDIRRPWVDLLLPRRCLLCQIDIFENIICECCLSLCNSCKNPQFGRQRLEYGALFYYELAIKDIIKQAKFHNNLATAHLLMELVAKELAESGLLEKIRDFSPCAITFVPAHFSKKLTHSINLPILFANLLSAKLKVPLVSLLKKRNRTRAQSSLSRRQDRISAIKGAFALKYNNKTFEKLILVDDIFTTGSTFDETSKLLQLECSELRCVAMAKTP